MAWIPSYQSLATHRKLLAFANELGIERATAIGLLHLFWWWCYDNAPTGSLNGIKALQIATALTWNGDPQDLFNALVRSRFIESCGRGGKGLRIHNWDLYAGKFLKERAADRERKRRGKGAEFQRPSGGVPPVEERRGEEKREEKTTIPPCSPPKGGRTRTRKNQFDRYRNLIDP